MIPLHYAAENGHSEVAEILLQNGAIVDSKEEIMSAAAYDGNVKVADRESFGNLLKRIIDPNSLFEPWRIITSTI